MAKSNDGKFTKMWWKREGLKIFLCCFILVAMYWVHWLADWIGGTVGVVINAFVLFSIGWMFVLLLHRVMQKSIYLIVSFVLLFLYGVTVYSLVPPDKYCLEWSKMLAYMNSTFSVFFPSRGGYEPDFSDYSIYYTLLHFFSYVYIAMLGMSLFGRKVMSKFIACSTPKRFKNVFWGYSDGGVLLAKDIMRNTSRTRAIFVLDENSELSSEQNKFHFTEIDGIGGAAIYCNLMDKAEKLEAAKHLFLSDDQDLNVKLAFIVLQSIAKKSKKDFRCELYVRTELTNIDRYFSKAKENLKAKVEINIVKESELAARRFIDKCKPLELSGVTINDDLSVKGNINVLQLGYGWTGRAILDKVICNTRFVGSKFSATIFDRDLESKHGFYPILDKECFGDADSVNDYQISAESKIEIGSKEFKGWIEREFIAKEFNLVVVALGNDAMNVEIALAIAKVLNSKGHSYTETSKMIYAHVRNRDCYTYFEMDETPISIFGNKNKIYTMNIIVNDELDELAKELNYYYNFKREVYKNLTEVDKKYINEKNEKWHTAHIIDQESSRAAAYAVDATLRLCNLKRVKSDETGIEVHYPIGDDTFMKNLYINEHNRWNAFHFTQGIKCWDLADVTYETFQGKRPRPNRIKELNRHAALVTYDKLEEIDKFFNQLIDQYNSENEAPDFKPAPQSELQEVDKKFVRDIAIVLSRIDYKIIEIEKKDDQCNN